MMTMMMTTFSVFSSLVSICFVASELTMMLVWGIPDSLEYAETNSSLNWEECIEQCYESQPCVLAWQVNETCANYQYDSFDYVAKTTSDSESIVAFKVENSGDECPVGTNAPTFNKTNATGSLYVDYDPSYFPYWVYYTIYLYGNLWKMDYNLNISCVGNFAEIIEHSDGSALCATAWYESDSAGFTWDRGVVLCNNKSSTYARLQYIEDFNYWSGANLNARKKLNNFDSYARIDGKRTTACQSTPNSTLCMSPKGFDFTGPPVTSFENYNWVTDASARATNDSDCLVLVLEGNNTVKTDVRGCNTTSPLLANLVECTAAAWVFPLV